MKTQKTNKLIGGLLLALMALAPLTVNAQRRGFQPRQNVPLDSIVMSDPAVLADSATQMYYMTGTGGMMWKSKDLKLWDGPYRVAETDPTSWMGPRPMIWAAEFHKYKDKYYYFATFTNREVKIDTVKGNVIERRASHVLVSDKAEGPYKPMADPMYLPADKPTLDGTFWVDTNGKPYLVYCYEWLQNWDGTIEYIQLKDDLSGTVGEATLMFKSSTCPWSREKNEKGEIEVAAEDKFSGEKVDVKEKGVLTVTTVAPGFASTTVEVANDKAFTTTHEIDFQHMTAEELIAKGFEALDPLDSENTSGESNWTGRKRFNYQIATGEVDEEGNPTYTTYVVYGPSTQGFEPIQRYRFLQSKLDETTAHSLFAPLYTWWYNDGITPTSLNEEGTGPAVDANGNEGGSVNVQVKLGIGLVHSGVQGDTETYDPAGTGYGNIRVNNATLGVDGLTDEDFIMIYKIGDYGTTSKHPQFPAGTDPEAAKNEYKAMHLGDLLEIYTGLETFQLYRVDTALNYVRILKGNNEGIEEINTGAIISDHNAPIYNLNGIQVNPKSLQRGVYIKQGKKFIVR